MQRTTYLQELLQDLAGVYHDDPDYDARVEFDSPPHAKPDGTVAVDPNVRELIGRNLDGPQELAVVVDTLSHEVEHLRETPLRAKQEISEEYGPYGKLAGMVYNILEDAYIDDKRTRRLPGLRKTRAFKIARIMENHHRRPRVDNMDSPAAAAVEGILQVSAAGYAKGFQECDDDLRRVIAWGETMIDKARETDDPEARIDLAREVTDRIVEVFGPGAKDVPDQLDPPPGGEPEGDPGQGDGQAPDHLPDPDGDDDGDGQDDDGDDGQDGGQGGGDDGPPPWYDEHGDHHLRVVPDSDDD